jgi:hypothetical protein
MAASRHLGYENQQVLTLVQAMLGAISPNVRAVSIDCLDDGVHLYFVLEQDRAEDREEIEDIAAEFEALQEGPIEIETHVSISSERWPKGVGSVRGRPVYVRRGM